jgi:O-antigen/teichoic acid export membrane protein
MGGVRIPLATVARVKDAVRSPQLVSWTKTLTRFLTLEALVQGLTFACGILIVRALPKADYALFTLANTMQATMNLMADNGIGSGLISIGGRVWKDRSRFGQLITTAMRLRRGFAIISVTLVTPLLFWMLVHNGASLSYGAIITAVVLLGFYFQLTVGVLMPVPRLHLEVNRIQNLNVWSTALRLILLVIAYGTFLNTAVAMLAAAISLGLQELLLRRWVPRMADPHAPANESDRREILNIVRAQAPNSIYYCVQSQLTVWLISVFGSATGVAEVGALGRIAVIFAMLASVMGNVIYPRFARVQEPQLLWLRYWQILSGHAALALILLALAGFFPDALLWVLGPKYSHLKAELFLMVLNGVLFSILACMWQLNVARGWIVSPWLMIPIGIVAQVILIMLLDVSQVSGVLWLNIYSMIPGFFLNLLRTRQGIRDFTAGHAQQQPNA